MSDRLTKDPDLARYLDTSADYTNTATEFYADDSRWLLVTQSSDIDGGQLLFQFSGNQLIPVRSDSIINLNPSYKRLRELQTRMAVGPASPQDHQSVAAMMKSQVNVFSSEHGPGGGNLACVWAVSRIVKMALHRWITRVEETSAFTDELKASLGHTSEENEVPEGAIIISPTDWHPEHGQVKHGHVGLLGPRVANEDRRIYSNSSRHSRWEQNLTLSKWIDRYRDSYHLRVHFFPIPADENAMATAAGSREFTTTAAVPSADYEESLIAEPNPLAGEAPPRRNRLILRRGFERSIANLPIDPNQARTVAHWLKSRYHAKMQAAVSGTPFSIDHLCGMVCQESAYFWVGLIDRLPESEILARCVLDASGDYPGTDRSAFPVNSAAFRERFGNDFTNMLIAEANATRAIRGFRPQHWVYKGYGIFQFDLQAVLVPADRPFFENKQWYSFDTCLARATGELKEKYRATHDVWKAIKAYNGSGASATEYANNVLQFTDICAEVNVA